MRWPPAYEAIFRQYPCNTCGAPRGQACRDLNEVTGPAHQDRADQAKAAQLARLEILRGDEAGHTPEPGSDPAQRPIP